MAQRVTIGARPNQIFRGMTKTLVFSIVDRTGTAVDVTGWTTQFVVGVLRHSGGTAELFTLPGTVVGTYTAVNNSQVITVAITPTELDFPPGDYDHSLARTNAGFKEILAEGPFIVHEATQT